MSEALQEQFRRALRTVYPTATAQVQEYPQGVFVRVWLPEIKFTPEEMLANTGPGQLASLIKVKLAEVFDANQPEGCVAYRPDGKPAGLVAVSGLDEAE